MEEQLEKNFQFLATYPRTKYLNLSNIFMNCTYKIKNENNILTADFSDCKNIKKFFELHPSRETKIFEDYIKEFEKKPKDYMIEYLDNVILKNNNVELCFKNENSIITTNDSRSCLFEITNNKDLFSKYYEKL